MFVFRSLVLMAIIVGTSYYIDRSQDTTIQPVVPLTVDTLLQLSWPLQSQCTHIIYIIDLVELNVHTEKNFRQYLISKNGYYGRNIELSTHLFQDIYDYYHIYLQ